MSPQSASAGGIPGKDQGSPTSSTVLPGYRDSIFGGNAHVAWREELRDPTQGSNNQFIPLTEGLRDEIPSPLQQVSRAANSSDRRSSYAKNSLGNSLNLTGSQQHAHRTGQGQPPPLISESTSRSSGSSVSTNSTAFFTPRTPLEPSYDRALPLPSLYPQKSTSHFENQLPPLRRSSLSPQSTVPGSQQSPNGMTFLLEQLISSTSCN